MSGYIGSKSSVTQVDGYNRTEADDRYVNVAGDTMTGALGIGTAPRTTPSTMLHVREDDSVDHLARIAVQSADQMLVAGSKWQAGVEQYSFLKSTNAAETVGQPMRIQIGDNTALGIDSSGRVTMPYQPAFTGTFVGSMSGNIVLFNNVGHNVGNHYNTATGIFTAPVAGVYDLRCNLLCANGSSVMYMIAINGTSNHNRGQEKVYYTGGGYSQLPMHNDVSLQAGDTIWITLGSGSLNSNGSGSDQYNALSIRLVG